MTIKLDRSQVNNILRAITAVECDQLNMALITDDEEAKLNWTRSADGWKKLHDNIAEQLDAFDRRHNGQ